MAGVAQKAAAVGEHADEVAQQAEVRQAGHLGGHAGLGVVEPPAAAQLDLARHLRALEGAQNRRQHVVVRAVQAVEDHPRQLAGRIQRVEIAADRLAAADGRHRVKPGVRAEQLEHPAVGVAQAVVVDLHRPAVFGVLAAQVQQYRRLVLFGLLGGHRFARHRLFEDGGHLLVAGRAVGHVVEPLIRRAAARRRKIFNAGREGLAHAVDAAQLDARHRAQLPHVVGKARLVDVDRLVRPERGADLDREAGVRRQLFVPFEVVAGVVGGADHRHVALQDQAADGHVRVVLQFVVAEVPDLLGRLAVEGAGVAEKALQLEMAPVDHRVADRLGQRLGELLELLAVGRVAGDVLFVHPVRAHDPPLVMVPPQPDLGDVLEPAVLEDLFGADMAVVVRDRHALGVLVEEGLGGLGLEQEILVHKRFHGTGTLLFFHRRRGECRAACPGGVWYWMMGGCQRAKGAGGATPSQSASPTALPEGEPRGVGGAGSPLRSSGPRSCPRPPRG